jgi:hypothetical protein
LAVEIDDPSSAMNASNPAADSALWFLEPATDAIEPREGARKAFAVIIMDIAVVEQEGAGVLQLLQESRKTACVFMGTVGDQASGAVPKSRPLETELEVRPGKVRQQNATSKRGWTDTVAYALLFGCCAVTIFFVFQADSRLRANENSATALQLRSETSALPARLATHTTSRFRSGVSKQASGGNRELAGNMVNDIANKTRASRERPFQQKQSRVCIQSAQPSDRH